MYTEDDLLPLSALQHLAFCPRQWGLIHLEQVWAENRLTAEGRALHEKTHSDETENRPDLRIVRGLWLHSYRLGLIGQADVVEFVRWPAAPGEGVKLDDAEGFWRPVPVEYKRGKPKPDLCDEVQLCAQALCLEEMLHVWIEEGAIYYGQPRRRQAVQLDAILRQETELQVRRMHELFRDGITPSARYEKKCQSCSLLEICMPKITGVRKDVEYYLQKDWTDVPEDGM